MMLTIEYRNAPPECGGEAAFSAATGDFDSAGQAKQIGIATATENPQFTWVHSLVVLSDQNEILAEWKREDDA